MNFRCNNYTFLKTTILKVQKVLLLSLMLISFGLNSQTKNIPLQSYYKNQFLKYSGKNSLETFYPVNESYLNLSDSLKDTSILYYDFHVWFFKKNWIEISEKYGKLEISPLINFSYGKGSSKSDSLPIYRNTRGIYARGEFLNKLTYSFIFCENQSRFMDYESKYFNDRGELYDKDSLFDKVNAVIPSGARTKPFKINAYDYAFSFGSFAYQYNEKIRIEAGNNQHFIGSGYRSLLLSDNSIYAPYIRFLWEISPKISYQILYRKHKNLFRKPATFAVESAYENKLFSANYLTYTPTKNFSVSLFSAGNQLRADSTIRNPFQAQMLVPLPFLNSDLFLKNKIINGIAGLNLDLALDNTRIYSQIAIDKYSQKYLLAYQTGVYFFNLLNLEKLNLQFELNYVPNQFYADNDTKLNYGQYNLPLAHPKGNNFTELYTNINYEFKRLYLNNSFLIYFTKGGSISDQIQTNNIFLTDKNLSQKYAGNTLINTFEVGYRINKKYNPTLYIQFQIRKSEFKNFKSSDSENNLIMAGLKVNLFNQYLDF